MEQNGLSRMFFDQLDTAQALIGAPDAITHVMVASHDGDWTEFTVAATLDALGFVKRDDKEPKLKVVTADELIQTFEKFIYARARSSDAQYRFKQDSFATLLAIGDQIQRQELEAKITHTVGEIVLTKTGLEEEIQYAKRFKDRRWQLPFYFDLLEEARINLQEGLRHLVESGYLAVNGDNIDLTSQGIELLQIVLNRKLSIGVQSIFQYQERINIMSGLFIQTATELWYIDVDQEITCKTIDRQAFADIILKMVAPGEKFTIPMQEKEIVDKKPKFCAKCGQPLKPGVKFCRTCGRKIS